MRRLVAVISPRGTPEVSSAVCPAKILDTTSILASGRIITYLRLGVWGFYTQVRNFLGDNVSGCTLVWDVLWGLEGISGFLVKFIGGSDGNVWCLCIFGFPGK